MKESVTKFDLEAAFKALDDITAPAVDAGIKANKPALTEIFSRKSKFDALFEEYYDIGSTEELNAAKEARDAEVAKAKLARIEKIVDLDAESPEDILVSYVGKYIIQCPQCMTLFYKNPEDVVESEDDASTVNVEEVCQHCGNDAGYTLIGKVGEASPEEDAEQFDFTLEDDEVVEDETAEDTNLDELADTANDNEELNLDELELEPLDLDDEESAEGSNKKEESIASSNDGGILVETLKENQDLDVSASEFEDLINSPEFKKPVSDTAVRTMLASEEENNLEESQEAVTEYALTFEPVGDVKNEDLTNTLCDAVAKAGVKWHSAKKLAGKYHISILGSETELTTAKLAIENCGFFKNWLKDDQLASSYIDNDENDEVLTEGGLADLGKAIGKKIGQVGKNIKNNVSTAIDKLTDDVKSREEKADWVLANACEDYSKAKINRENELVPDELNRRFNTFVIICYEGKYTNGRDITMAPSFSNKDLKVGKNGVQVKPDYKSADSIAKGWSMTQGNGPAFIYLAKDKDDDNAVFLCEYFKGKLENDQLEKYFNVVKRHLEGAKLLADGGMEATDEDNTTDNNPANADDVGSDMTAKPDDTEENSDAENAEAEAAATAEQDSDNELASLSDKDLGKEILASKLKAGMTIVDDTYTGKFDGVKQSLEGCTVLKVKVYQAKDIVALTVKNKDGKEASFAIRPNSSIIVADVAQSKKEESFCALSTVIDRLEELQEASLEERIADSLIESYKNVAGFRLTGCSYLNETLSIKGNIYLTSGNTIKTVYNFTEACVNEDKIAIHGLNETLGLNKSFIITGNINTDNKTLITEAFKAVTK